MQNSLPSRDPLWERACSRKRWFSHPRWWQLHRHRRQASSHLCFAAYAKFPAVPRSPVGAGLLAKAVVQSPSLVAVAPPSQASQLPLLFCSACKIPCRPEILCGSGLARESGGSVTLVGGSCTAIAGKPAPTFVLPRMQNSLPSRDPLWERACSRKRWFSHSRWWQLHRHRRQASSHLCFAAYAKFPAAPRSLVGAGLPAKAVVQSPSLVTGT